MRGKNRKTQALKHLLLTLSVVFLVAAYSADLGIAQDLIVIHPSGDGSGITDYNNLMDSLNPALGATANIRCVSGAELNDGETFTIQDLAGFSTFEFDFDSSVGPGNTPVTVDTALTKEQVAAALAAAINSTGLQVDAMALPDFGYNVAWVLLTQENMGTVGNGRSISETVAASAFIAQTTFEGGSDGPGPNPGDVISLAAGNYSISRSIRVENFDGVVTGAGKDGTIVEAVREFPGAGGGFGFAHDPFWPNYPMGAGHFRFYFPKNITFKDLTLQVTDPSPCDFLPYSGGITSLAGFALEIAGSTPSVVPDIVVRDVKLLGAAGDDGGKNLPYAMFVVLGDKVSSPNYWGKGNIIIENCYVSDAAWRGIVMGTLTDNSLGVIKGCTIEDSGHGIRVFRVDDSRCEIIENKLFNVWWYPVWLLGNVSGADIRNNAFSGGTYHHVRLRQCSSVTVSGNTFQDFNGDGLWWKAPIFLNYYNHDCVISNNEFININGAPAAVFVRGRSGWEDNTNNFIVCNDYRQSNLPGWTSGPGCVLLDPNTADNIVGECLFPEGTTALDQINDFGINNQIVTCPEGLIHLLIRKVERLVESGILKESHGMGLVAKLNEALKNLNKDKPNERVACNKLGDFIDQVNAYINSGRLSPEEGQDLIDTAIEAMFHLCG
jgi:hypothetical protein